MKIGQAKEKLLNDAEIRQVFQRKDSQDLKINVGLQILELRILKKVTQEKLAKMIGTAQPSIARAERGALLPSLGFLHKIAVALGTEFIYPKFAAVVEHELIHQTASFVGESFSGTPETSGVQTTINESRIPTRALPVKLMELSA